MNTRETLLAALESRLDAGTWSWLHDASASAARGGLEQLLTAYTAASQRLGVAPLHTSPEDGRGSVRLERWTFEDAGRAVLLLARAEASPDPAAFEEAAVACYEQGDAREQQSWLRAVGVLPDPGRFLHQAVDACRTSIQPVFDAIACENPYPAQFFPERNFNQMVLKALFNGVALARVVGLPGRLNAELSRMAADYAAERRAAGRSVPGDIALVLADSGSKPEPRS